MTGGWGIDALIGRQTRDHRDIDLGIGDEALDAALAALGRHGFEVTTDWRPVRIELSRRDCHVDLHPLTYGSDGRAWQAGLDDTRPAPGHRNSGRNTVRYDPESS